MELLTFAAMVAGLIAAIICVVILIKKIIVFYRERFQFSIWSGVLMLVMALALVAAAVSEISTQQAKYIMIGIAAIFSVLTIYNDMRLAGVGWGSLAVMLQIGFSLVFVFLIFFALVGYVLKKVFKTHNSVFGSIFSGLGLREELLLLVRFLFP